MKTTITALTNKIRTVSKSTLAGVIVTVTIAVLSSAAMGVTVQTYNRNLNGGTADFGSGLHSFGSPTGNGIVTFDYSYVNNQLLVTARVNGTLYWDSLFSSGCARLTIRYRDYDHNNLAIDQVNVCGPGGDANNSSNKATVNKSFTDPFLWHVHISVNEVQNGTLLNGVSNSVAAPQRRVYGVIINSGTADFGSDSLGLHVAGSPTKEAEISFSRSRLFSSFGLLGVVRGKLYYDSLVPTPGCVRAVIDFRDESDALLDRNTFDLCGPGFDTGSPLNQLKVEAGYNFYPGSFGDFNLFRIRLRVGTVSGGSFVNVTSKTFDFNGPVGNFELEPSNSSVEANEQLNYALTWNVPESLNWHDLRSIRFRITDDTETILLLHWDEASNSFSLFNEVTGRFGKAFAAGSNARLQTPLATLDLANTTVAAVNNPFGSGPLSPSVLLNLALRFKPSAAGRTYRVDVAASDDLGNDDPFTFAGTLTVNH